MEAGYWNLDKHVKNLQSFGQTVVIAFNKFDNRHKLNLSLRYAFNKKVSCFAVWNYHTGNHALVGILDFGVEHAQDAALHGVWRYEELVEAEW